jgi:hypothetical protein
MDEPRASYLMDDVLVRVGDKWESLFGTSAGGITLSSLGDEDRGVLRLEDQAPEGASSAVVMYGGQEHRVPVRYGHFLFVAWNAPSAFEDPILIGVDWTGRRQI